MARRRSITLASVASMLLHVLLLLATWNLDLMGGYEPDERKAAAEPVEETVEFVLLDDAALPDLHAPEAYTSVPERHAAPEPPSEPDFLALHDSRAADLLPGGDAGSAPGTEQTSEITQVAIDPHVGGGTPGGVAVVETPTIQDGDGRELRETDGESGGVRPGVPEPAVSDGELAVGEDRSDRHDEDSAAEQAPTAPELADLPDRSPPSILDDRHGPSGDPGFDYQQENLSAGGNMIQFGEFRLNTLSWDFAPWLEQFKRDFYPHWIPPYAYRLGVIHGKTMLRLIVEKDGTIGGLEVIDEEGHDSLHNASMSALRASAPFAPLPPDFPEEHLELELGLHYP